MQLTASLYSTNAVISAVLAARAQVSQALICEAEASEEVAGHFRYLLALIGHLYCYTYEVMGAKVIVTLPSHFNRPSCALSAAEVDVVFENSDYLLDFDASAINSARETAGLAPVAVQRLAGFQLRHFPPFNYPLSNEQIPQLAEVVLGGTFDFLHPGHLLLLTCLSLITTQHIHLALTKDELLRNKRHPAFLQAYSSRERDLAFTMRFLAPHVSIHIFPLADPVGHAATEPWDGIVLSREVEKAETQINRIRRQNGLKELASVVVDLVQLGTQKMSSTDVRALLSERCGGQGEALLASWMELCSRIGVSTLDANDSWSNLFTSYLRYDRHAHTLLSISHMLQTVSVLQLSLSPSLQLAIWFLYFVLEPDHSDNFETSANACRDFLAMSRGMGCDQAPTLISAQKSPESAEEILLEDLSLAVLGCGSEQYGRYAVQIRREFSFWTTYTVHRTQFLAGLLARDSIYHNVQFQKAYESQARANLRKELEQLGSRSAQL